AFVYSTYLGGKGFEHAYGITVDASGNAFVVGYTGSTDFPVTNGSTYGNGGDAFVSELNSAGSALVYGTYLGGSGVDLGYRIAVDASGNAYIAGLTYSANFPSTADAFDGSFNGASGFADAFLA